MKTSKKDKENEELSQRLLPPTKSKKGNDFNFKNL